MNLSADNSPHAQKKIERKSEDKSWWQPGLVLFSRLSGWIMGPVVVSLLIGSWLDKKYGKSPWLILLCVAFGFLISMFGIVREAIQIMSKIEKEGENAKKKMGKNQDGGNLKNGERESNNTN